MGEYTLEICNLMVGEDGKVRSVKYVCMIVWSSCERRDGIC